MSVVDTLMDPVSPGAVQAAKHYYDAQFTEEISNKMRVPERLLPVQSTNSDPSFGLHRFDGEEMQPYTPPDPRISTDYMRVPERILVAGNETHVAGQKQIVEAKLESAFMGEDPLPRVSATAAMMTPPRTITLQDHHYPSVDPYDDESVLIASNNRVKQVNFDLSTLRSSDPLFSPSDALSLSYSGELPVTPGGSGDSSVIAMRKILRQLSRRVAVLERDNQSRQLREFLTYSIGLAYIAIRGFVWLTNRPTRPW